jgi:glyoxylase-like metal-dependent hydrolase (beta-lactamase superfamily II)
MLVANGRDTDNRIPKRPPRLAILASLVAAGMAAAGLHAQGLPPVGEIEQVTPRIWKIYGAGGNTTVFLRADGVALVDTKLASNGAAILAQVRKVTDKPVTLIVNTHSHGDHVGSNSEINAAGSIEVVAQASTSRRMAGMPSVGAATRTFDDRLTLGSGADRIELYWFGAGHTDGDAFVVFPAERVMASGDIFQMLAMPRIDRAAGGSALALPDTLAQAHGTIAGIDKVIDGHGTTIHDWAAFGRYAAFTRAAADAARKAEPDGGTAEQALASLEGHAETRPFVDDTVLQGARGRALNGLNAALEELRGQPPAAP